MPYCLLCHFMSRTRKRIPWAETTPLVRHAAMSTARPGNIIPGSWFRKLKDFDLWLICGGAAELTGPEGRKRHLSRGSVVCLAPGDIFELQAGPSAPYTNAYVHFDLLDGAGRTVPHDRIAMPPVTGRIHDIHYFESTLRRIMFLQYHYRKSDPPTLASAQTQSSHLLKGLLYDFQLANADVPGEAGLPQHHRQMVSSALSRIYLYPESTLSAAGLAKEFGHSQRHFCRIFRLVTGKTPGQTLIEARIDHAKKLLTTTSLNVTEISESLCYENVFYFSRQFKKVTGMAPTEFRFRLPEATGPPFGK